MQHVSCICLFYVYMYGHYDMYIQATNEVVTRVPCSTQEEMNSAAKAAEDAFPSWSSASVMSRQRVMFNLQHLIREHMVHIWLYTIYLCMCMCECACIQVRVLYMCLHKIYMRMCLYAMLMDVCAHFLF